jgi:putative membrane protein
MRVVLFSLVALLALFAVANQFNDHHMWGWGMHGSWRGGVIMWLLFIALIVVLVYFLLRQQNVGGSGTRSETALEILKKRYARGELSKEEYERMKKDLQE